MAGRFDVVVVGARCAGSPLATLLARAGLHVCLLDRARFPSDTPSTHGIQPSGVRLLERLGVLAPIARVGASIERATAILEDLRFELPDLRQLCGAPMINIRRVTLDAVLVDAAARAGADVRTGTPVTDLLWDGERVAGVQTAKGAVRADLVVGADGARSTVARLVGAREYARTEPERAFLWGYFEGADADADRLWLGGTADHGFLASFTDAGLFMAAVAPPQSQWGAMRADRQAAHAAGLRHWPELHACLTGARRVGPLQAVAHWHGFFRESAGPGWVLAGDAGHFKDPSPGQGIADALRQAFALAPAIGQALAGDAPPERPLRDWWRWRDRDAWEMYWFAHDLGAAGTPPVLVRAGQRRVAREPELARGLMRVLNHDAPPSAVFTPAFSLTTTAAALRSGVAPRRTILREAGALAARQVQRDLARRAAGRTAMRETRPGRPGDGRGGRRPGRRPAELVGAGPAADESE